MSQFNLDEAKTHLSELVEAAIKGEAVYIVKDGQQQLVQLVPVRGSVVAAQAEKIQKRVVTGDTKKDVAPPTQVSQRQLDDLKGLVVIAPDFDAPLEDFNQYQ